MQMEGKGKKTLLLSQITLYFWKGVPSSEYGSHLRSSWASMNLGRRRQKNLKFLNHIPVSAVKRPSYFFHDDYHPLSGGAVLFLFCGSGHKVLFSE